MHADDLADVLDSVRTFVRDHGRPARGARSTRRTRSRRRSSRSARRWASTASRSRRSTAGWGCRWTRRPGSSSSSARRRRRCARCSAPTTASPGTSCSRAAPRSRRRTWLPRLASRRGHGLLRAHRGRGRLRPVGPDHRGRRDGDDWVINGVQALHHQRAGRRRLHGLRPHRPRRRRQPRHLGVPGPGASTSGPDRRARRTTRWASSAPGPRTSTSTTCACPPTP